MDAAAQVTSVVEPWYAEKKAYEELVDFSAGFNAKNKFNVLVFWANPSIIATFPLLSTIARSQFSGLPHEATSERTFSFSGRTCSDLRASMAIEQVCAHVLANAALKHRPVTAAQIKGEYASKRTAKKRKEAESAIGSGAAGL